MSFYHVPGIYIMFYDILSIPSKSSGSVPVFIIGHHTIPHLQEALSASCQPVAAATPTSAQCWTVSAWCIQLHRFRIIVVASTRTVLTRHKSATECYQKGCLAMIYNVDLNYS